MAKIFEDINKAASNIGMNVLGGVSRAAGKVLGEDLAGQLFDNYVPLERYTEYQRTYNWEIVFPFLMGNVPGAVISKFCKAVAFGDYKFEELVKQNIGPKQFFTPGSLSIDAVTAVFLVSTPNFLQGYFDEWKKLIVDEDGYYYPQNNYKKTVYIRTYTTQGITSGTIKLKGVFPKTFYRYELSYETQDVVRYTITFSVDDIEFSGIDVASTIPRVLKTLF